ncbi:NADPH-adrenodoxin reductase [Coemansia aciculifera]|uniref:NADPH:adrenodoxin oxidoreductase, mitochondrial n=1 Tax=Coemansia aciculifera TaxID=417176 RepID=A0A9W8M3T0_9FUNG|nr:NADPH-adrenodoxin reductase [Coemansia aciculifera]
MKAFLLLLPTIRTASPGIRRFSVSVHAFRDKNIAIVGGGAAGFYTAARVLAKTKDVNVDIFEQLPTPFGLVRFGVAPDHPEVKNCTTKFDQVSGNHRVRYFGNIQVGRQLTLDKLRSVYDGVVLSYGASEDRKLGIPGEDGMDGKWGVVPARQFVAWYNGLPEAQGLRVDLKAFDKVVIVGHGNVALDCARILLTDPKDLATTDITAHALDTLRGSNVRHVEMVGRRGPLQVAFTTKELREMTKIPEVDFICDRDLVTAECTKWAEWLDNSRSLKRMMDLLMKHAVSAGQGGRKSFTLSFLKSPVEVVPDQTAPQHIRFQVNRLEGPVDQAKAVGTGEFVDVPCGLILRSIGYASTPLGGAPFDGRRKIVPNIAGRVTDNDGELVPGLYAAGWVKRGPVGVIATTMQDAYRTADAVIMDISNGHIADGLSREAVDQVLDETGVLESCVTNAQWKLLEAFEAEAGQSAGKPREKVTDVDRMLSIVRK